MRQSKRKRVTSPAGDPDPGGDPGAGQGAKKGVRTRKKVTVPSSSTDDQKEEYHCWLMKSEPESRMEKGVDMKFGIEDLKVQPDKTACWDGVRNYQARNFMRAMKIGQQAFFYHSNCKEPGIAGIVKDLAGKGLLVTSPKVLFLPGPKRRLDQLCDQVNEIVKEAYPDHTQFDPKNPHYDSSSQKDNPKWSMVDVQFVRMLKRYISLAELKELHQKHKIKNGPLRNMALFTRARLSVQPLRQEEFDFILSLEEEITEQRSES